MKTELISAYAAIVSTATFVWNVWRQVTERGRLEVHIAVTEIVYGPSVATSKARVLGGTVTNVGRKPIYLTAVCGLHADKTRSVWLPSRADPRYELPTYPCELKEGAQIRFRVPLDVLRLASDRPALVAFCAEDTHGRQWRAPRRMFKKVRASALEHLEKASAKKPST